MTAPLPAQARLHPDGTLAHGHRFVIVEPVQALPGAIRYAAWDLQFGDTCEILEHTYGPWADRLQGRHDVVLRGNHADAAAHIAAAAMEHARAVGRSKHPSHLRLRAVWRENGTVYVATDAPQGLPLPAQPTPAWRWRDCEPVFRQLLEALRELHALGTYHGGLGAHCIFVRADGLPELRLGDVRLSERGTAMAVADAAEADLADFANSVMRLFGPAGHQVGAAMDGAARRAALVAAGLSDGWADAVVAFRSHPSPGTVDAFLSMVTAPRTPGTVASAASEPKMESRLDDEASVPPVRWRSSRAGRVFAAFAGAILLLVIAAKLLNTQAGGGAGSANAAATWRPDGTPDPAAFAFVVHEGTESYLILGPGSENTAATAAPELLTGFGHAFQPLNGAGELGAWEPWLGRSVSMFGPKSECSAKVGSIGTLVRFDGGDDSILVNDEAPDGIDKLSDTRLAELTFEYAGDDRFVAARLVNTSGTGCDETIWGRVAELPSLDVEQAQKPDFLTVSFLETSLRELPAWDSTQKKWSEVRKSSQSSEHPPDWPVNWENYQTNDFAPKVAELSLGNGPDVVWANAYAGDGDCGNFTGSITAMWIRNSGKDDWKVASPVSEFGDTIAPTSAFDLDNDAMPEILFGTGNHLVLMRALGGTYAKVLEYQISYRGCPC